MNEIELNTNNQPERTSKNKTVWVIAIGVVLIVAIIIGLVVGLDGSDKKAKFDMSGTSLNVDYVQSLGYHATVNGTLKNVSQKDYSYVSIEFIIYDIYGNNLGTALDNINNLQRNDTWKFEAILFSYVQDKPVRFEFVEIIAW